MIKEISRNILNDDNDDVNLFLGKGRLSVIDFLERIATPLYDFSPEKTKLENPICIISFTGNNSFSQVSCTSFILLCASYFPICYLHFLPFNLLIMM